MSVNVYEIVTNKILAELEKGLIPWRKPWQSHGVAINYVSRKPYRGINVLLLDQPGEYATFKQVKDNGGCIKAGAKASMIVFYKTIEKENTETGEIETFPCLRYSNVFHISQTTLESKLEPIELNDTKPIETAENAFKGYINRSSVTVDTVENSSRASYYPAVDTITLPCINQFDNANEYYSVAFHEAAHSTGHKSRLNRLTESAAFGSESYSKEELIAELSAAMILSTIGIEIPQTLENSAAYIRGWSKKLREDKTCIVKASSAAQKSTDLILDMVAAGA